MADLIARLRAGGATTTKADARMKAEAANEIERLRAMVKAAALTCEQCGKPANIADQDDWTFCGVECMEAMRTIAPPIADDVRGILKDDQGDSDGQR